MIIYHGFDSKIFKYYKFYIDKQSQLIIKDNKLISKNKILLSANFKILKSDYTKFNTIIICDNSCFQQKYKNDELVKRCPRPIYLKFMKSDLKTIYPNLLDYYNEKYQLHYNKSWLINKDGIILFLLSNMNGVYSKKKIMTINNITSLISKIRLISSNKIIIRPHKRDINCNIIQSVKDYYEKYNIVIDTNKIFKHKLTDIKCIISDMTCFALYFAFLGIPLFNFSEDELFNTIAYKDIYIRKIKIIKDNHFHIKLCKTEKEKYIFFNKYMNHLYFSNDKNNVNLIKNIL